MRGNYSSVTSHVNKSQQQNNMDTACVSVIKGSRRTTAVDIAKANHAKQCEDRILARARATNAGSKLNGK